MKTIGWRLTPVLGLGLAACGTPIGDHWTPGATIALVLGAGVILWGGWRYYLGGDERRTRRQARRDDRRD